MPLVGVICPADGSCQSFATCIHAHEQGGSRNCDAPVQILKIMRDNHVGRKHAGWSASTLLSCARTTALQEKYDYFEDVKSGYNKGRGEWVHAMMEADTTPREGLIREVRIRKYFTVNGQEIFLTGKPDEVDSIRGLLIDYKSKDRIPKTGDIRHEAQFNVYVWLLDGGFYVNEDGSQGEQVDVKIRGGGMHYLTWNPKDPFKKMAYPIWEREKLEKFLVDRLTPLLDWKNTDSIPKCNAYIKYPGKWRCDCVKLEEQLKELGTWNEF